MARRKNPENETTEEKNIRQHLDGVADNSSRSEKVSWNRKMDNMVKLMASLRPIEEEIVRLSNQKIPVFDEIQELRKVMVLECVHPFDYLLHKEDHISCKFCNKNLSIPTVDND